MEYIYIFFIVLVILIILGIVLYSFPKTSKKITAVTPKVIPNPEKPTPKESQKTLPLTSELIVLRQELMTMSSHNERIYKSNLEIARRDFSKKGTQNFSETELLKRAIEIWRNDNR